MWEEIQVAYKKYYDSIYPPKDGKSNYQIFTEEQAQNRANLALKYGFIDTSYKIYYRNRSYSADDYVSLINIYSDVIALPEKNRQYLCADIKKAIEAHGGTIVLRDMIDIEMAKKEC